MRLFGGKSVESAPRPLTELQAMMATSVEASLSQPHEPCSSCNAACCRQGKRIGLKAVEAFRLQECGTAMHEVAPPPSLKNVPADITFYRLDSDCAFLDQDTRQCKIHEYPELLPEACQIFTAGSNYCLDEFYEPISDLRDGLASTAPPRAALPLTLVDVVYQ